MEAGVMAQPSSRDGRTLEFQPTPAVNASRSRKRFVRCPACQADAARYLFHKVGVRFVRCGACDMVYVNPSSESPINYFDIDGVRPFTNDRDRELTIEVFGRLLERLSQEWLRLRGAPLNRTLLLGRYLRGFRDLKAARDAGLEFPEIDAATFHDLALDSNIAWAVPYLEKAPQVVILHELLEACRDPGAVLQRLTAQLPAETLFVVTYTNVDSIPARVMRRYWPPFFEVKAAFFSPRNLSELMARFDLVLREQFPLMVNHTVDYVAERLAPNKTAGSLLRSAPAKRTAVPLRAGNWVSLFTRWERPIETGREKLSIILPVFNEVRYVAQVIETILSKTLPIERELIVVESNSTDGTRDIVKSYEGRPGLRVLFEDRPQGKGHAVKTGLAAVSGTIVLIQDADFEYDVEDYDALLEPILQHKANFVLGSRSLGLDDWKVRRFGTGATKALALNVAQLFFAWTFNVLYRQHATDINTMYKVFRTECLAGVDLKSDGFNLDIELACKLARNGNSPMEVPVNYVARGFDEGKKISFVRDAVPSYLQLFKSWLG
jgi:hypothetical protein